MTQYGKFRHQMIKKREDRPARRPLRGERVFLSGDLCTDWKSSRIIARSLVRSFFLSSWCVPSFLPSFQNSESESARSIFVVHRRLDDLRLHLAPRNRDISHQGRRRRRGKKKGKKEYGDFLPSWEINAASSSSKRENVNSSSVLSEISFFFSSFVSEMALPTFIYTE